MKRFHVHVGVADLDQSIGFYSALFAAQPTVVKDDYAKWMLDDPCVNFAISSRPGMTRGIEHVGIEAETPEELADVYAKLNQSGRPVFDEGEAQCCYAKSTKNWVTDPDGVIWEAFHTHGEITSYGNKIDKDAILATAGADKDCCTPETPQGVCCPPKADKAADASCCG
jgi:hypothetical protein